MKVFSSVKFETVDTCADIASRGQKLEMPFMNTRCLQLHQVTLPFCTYVKVRLLKNIESDY